MVNSENPMFLLSKCRKASLNPSLSSSTEERAGVRSRLQSSEFKVQQRARRDGGRSPYPPLNSLCRKFFHSIPSAHKLLAFHKSDRNNERNASMTQENAKQDQTSSPRRDDRPIQTQMLGTVLAGLLAMVCSTPATPVVPATQISEDTLAGGGDSEADTEAEPH